MSLMAVIERYPDWKPAFRVPENVALSRMAYIATCDFPLGRSSERRNCELLSQESSSRSSFARSRCAFRTHLSYRSLFFSMLSRHRFIVNRHFFIYLFICIMKLIKYSIRAFGNYFIIMLITDSIIIDHNAVLIFLL